MNEQKTFCNGSIHLFCGDSLELYDKWETPTVIISDGPYGVNGFPGDLVTPDGLDKWYEPHIKKWSELATPLTTLWFWNTEVGWATVHPILEKYGWTYVSCCVWDKGMSHVAGNTNTKTIRHLPVVTEVCVQYVKKPVFKVGKDKPKSRSLESKAARSYQKDHRNDFRQERYGMGPFCRIIHNGGCFL